MGGGQGRPRARARAGRAILVVSAVVVAGAPSDDSARLTLGLVLLGVGWSCGLVAGSALLIDATPTADRTPVQGLSDFAMNLGERSVGCSRGSSSRCRPTLRSRGAPRCCWSCTWCWSRAPAEVAADRGLGRGGGPEVLGAPLRWAR
ncbi:hypothetical protein NKG05_08185 [Oerskovia sp. M15]